MNKDQRGFGVVEGLLIVIVFSLIGLMAWVFMQRQDSQDGSTNQSVNQSQKPPEINDANDLEKAENYLQETDIDKQVDTSEVDQALND